MATRRSLAGLPDNQLDRLQSVMNARAYSKPAVQPIFAVQDAICAVQNEKLCSQKTQS